jgi:predicted nucleic acid-binding Zn ribbon protein
MDFKDTDLQFKRDVRNAHIFFYAIAILFVVVFILKFV